jgi:hypothetical protein
MCVCLEEECWSGEDQGRGPGHARCASPRQRRPYPRYRTDRLYSSLAHAEEMSSSSSTRPLVGASLSRNVFEGIYDSVSKTAVLAASSNGHGKAFRQRILPRSMIPRNATPAGLRWHLHAFTGARDDVASSAIAFVYVLHRADTCGRPSSSREGYVPDESGPLKSNLTSSSPLFV